MNQKTLEELDAILASAPEAYARHKALTMNQLVALEPRLGELLEEAAEVARWHRFDAECYGSYRRGPEDGFCAKRYFDYGDERRESLRDRIKRLVGPDSPHKDDILGSREILRTAWRAVRAALPPCSGDICTGRHSPL